MVKSEISFNKNVSENSWASLSQILGVRQSLGSGKYLGLPSMIGRSKKTTFSYIKDCIWNRINFWNNKLLSMVGREILIKSVAQAIPSYCMSTYFIPSSLGEKKQRMLNSFWWGSSRKNTHGISWLTWDKLAIGKNLGGMDFRGMDFRNL